MNLFQFSQTDIYLFSIKTWFSFCCFVETFSISFRSFRRTQKPSSCSLNTGILSLSLSLYFLWSTSNLVSYDLCMDETLAFERRY